MTLKKLPLSCDRQLCTLIRLLQRKVNKSNQKKKKTLVYYKIIRLLIMNLTHSHILTGI